MRVVLPLLVALAAAFAPAAAQAKLAYQTGQAHPWVWVARDDGGGAHKLVRGVEPEIAPDGSTVVFGASFVSARKLRAIPADGGHARTLLRQWTAGLFAYSPDSRWVVAVAGPQVGAQRLVLIEVATGRTRVLAHGVFTGASFSPDSTRVVYDRAPYRDRGFQRPDLYVAAVAGGRSHRITTGGRSYQPVWGPKSIAYARWQTVKRKKLRKFGPQTDLWLIRPDGHGRRRLTHDHIPFLLTGLVPTAWSANGRRLLAQFGGQDTTYPKTVNPRTGRERVVGKKTEMGIVATALSRDGSTILGALGGFDPSTPAKVVTVPYGGGRTHVLVRGATAPSWTR